MPSQRIPSSTNDLTAIQRIQTLLDIAMTTTNPEAKNQRAFQLSLVVVAIATVVFLSAIYTLHVVSGGQSEAMIQRLRFKAEHMERQIALHNEKARRGGSRNEDEFTETGGMAVFDLARLSDPTSESFRLAREVSNRYNTRYWLETKPQWPATPLPEREKYITFEPWPGGFNNIRMSLEMAAALAIAMDRTLVLPPKYHMYLRGTSDFQDYFDYDDMRRGISTITYLQFRSRVRLGDYDGLGDEGPQFNVRMEQYFAGLSRMPKDKVAIHNKGRWNGRIASEMVFCFPNCPKAGKDPDPLVKWFEKIHYRLIPKDADVELEPYDIVHLPGNLLGHFYTFVWFRDPQRGRRVKRIIRDHIHFREEIFSMAEEIVRGLGGDFSFSCIHVRRNDFQFEEVWTPAEVIVKNTERLFNVPNETIYISTDELSVSKGNQKKTVFDPAATNKAGDHQWFTPFFERWGGREKVKFWSDFAKPPYNMANKVKSIWIGSVESVVCSRARVFVGTQKSTFTGYINRMRGYMHDVGQKRILQAQFPYPDHYYHALTGPSWSTFPHGSFGGGHPYWGQEYLEAWDGVYEPFF